MNPLIVATSLLTLTSLCNSADGSLTVKPVTTEVVVGDQVTLNCSTSEQLNVFWQHFGPGATTGTYVFYNGRLLSQYIERFEILRDPATGKYNLVIKSVRKEDAGAYRCMDKAGTGEDAEAELIVLDSRPQCKLLDVRFCNANKTNTEASCTIPYVGNIAPEIECSGAGVSTLSSTAIDQLQNEVTYLLKLDALWPIDESLPGACRTNISSIPSEFSHPKPQITYALGAEAVRQSQTNMAECTVFSNAQCSYEWSSTDTGTPATTEQTLTAVSNGNYYCTATCSLQGQTCQLTSNVVQLTSISAQQMDATTIAVIASVSIVVTAVLVITLVIVFICRKKLRSKGSPPSESQINSLIGNGQNQSQLSENGTRNGGTMEQKSLMSNGAENGNANLPV